MALGYLLGMNPLQNTPFIDATTDVLAIVATFLMMWRYKELNLEAGVWANVGVPQNA